VQMLRTVDPTAIVIDAGLITNPKAFFVSVITDAAFKRAVSADLLMMDFAFVDDPDIRQGFAIQGLVMANGKIVGGNLTTADQPFTRLPMLHCKVVRKVTRIAKFFNCPVFLNVFDDELEPTVDREIQLDQTENFICSIPLTSDKLEKTWLLNGTSIYWQMPKQFM
jgi:hypothetical protein